MLKYNVASLYLLLFHKKDMKLQKSILTVVLSLFMAVVYGQKPSVAPKGDYGPIDFTQTENIIIYIVLPIIVLILYFIWRSKKRKGELE